MHYFSFPFALPIRVSVHTPHDNSFNFMMGHLAEIKRSNSAYYSWLFGSLGAFSRITILLETLARRLEGVHQNPCMWHQCIIPVRISSVWVLVWVGEPELAKAKAGPVT